MPHAKLTSCYLIWWPCLWAPCDRRISKRYETGNHERDLRMILKWVQEKKW